MTSKNIFLPLVSWLRCPRFWALFFFLCIVHYMIKQGGASLTRGILYRPKQPLKILGRYEAPGRLKDGQHGRFLKNILNLSPKPRMTIMQIEFCPCVKLIFKLEVHLIV